MMSNLIPWWGFVIMGASGMLVISLPVFLVVCIWAGWPRRRERELGQYADELEAQIARLEAKLTDGRIEDDAII